MSERNRDSGGVPAWSARLPDLDDRQFSQWSALLEQRVGVIVPMERKSFLNTGLKLRMQEIGCTDFQAYYDRLSGSASMQEWSTLVDRLTVHETRFFRHESSLNLVRDHVLPNQPRADGKPHGFQAWSAGCATGEEVYTLAMMIDDHFARLGGQYFFGVTGTDISLPSLETARQGVYSNRRLPDIATKFQERYCVPATPDRFQVSESLRRRVCFSQLNIVRAASAPYGKMDLIFCQNLLIYFERAKRADIVTQLVGHLKPGGFLVVGPGEVMGWEHPEMERVRYEDTLAFRRLEPGAQAKEAS